MSDKKREPPYPHTWFRDKFTGIEYSCQSDSKITDIEYWDEDAQEWKPL